MRILLAVALTMTWLSAASAQKFDLDQVSCRELLRLDQQTMAYLIVWLRGFWTEADQPMILDLDRLQADADRMTDHCTRHPDVKVFAAADQIFQ